MPLRPLVYLIFAVLPCLAAARSSGEFSPQEIRTMHDFGVTMALEGERTPYVIPADIDPAHLVQAETIGFGGLDLHRLPPWLGRFTRLRHLDLSDTSIKVAQLAPLRRMQVLEHLNLTGVPLFAAGGGAAEMDALWASLGNLRILKLGGTGVPGGEASRYGRLGQLANLIHLDLSDNRLSDLAPLDLAALRLLRRLDLHGNRLGRLDPRQLPRNLDELDLTGSGLTAFPWSDGLDFPQLGEIKLSGNRGLRID